MEKIYESEFIAKLFDKMSDSYKAVNIITSFGFSEKKKKKCVNSIDLKGEKVVLDLLTGMGECWSYIFKQLDSNSKLIALDFSSEMVKKAELKRKKYAEFEIEILREDIFNNSLKSESIDNIVSGFGLKTFSDIQIKKFAEEIYRILKTGGEFSLIDVSIPDHKLLRFFYMFYLKKIIPLVGRIFLNNTEVYKMLGIYTENYRNSRKLEEEFKKHNFEIEYVEYFFGCATGIKGMKRA